MFDRLWHSRGSSALPEGLPDRAVLQAVADAVAAERKPVVIGGDGVSVSFEQGLETLFFMRRWSALALVNAGRIWIDRSDGGPRLRYDVSLAVTAGLCLAGSALVPVMQPDAWQETAKNAAFVFAWLYGGNRLAVSLLAFNFFAGIARKLRKSLPDNPASLHRRA